MNPSEEIHHWIRLLQVPNIGPQRYQKLLSTFEQPVKVFESSISQIMEAGISKKLAVSIVNQPTESTKADIEWLESGTNNHIITFYDHRYPDALKQIDNPPPLLYVQGNPELLTDPQLAIVGSRNPTQGGKNNAYEFSKYLSSQGLCITSGLALGIDGYSHKGALDAQASTIAVTGTGLDRVYPAAHHGLAHAISEQGAIVSEYCIGTPIRAANFPRRNRLISGLSVGVLVVEAAIKSGSLITAHYAMEQGKEVFALPGSIHNPLARGCHHLIREGAKLIETADHILEDLTPVLTELLVQHDKESVNSQSSTGEEVDSDQRQLLDAMGYDPVPIDQLVLRTGLTIDVVSSILLLLELQGYVSACGSGQYLRNGNS